MTQSLHHLCTCAHTERPAAPHTARCVRTTGNPWPRPSPDPWHLTCPPSFFSQQHYCACTTPLSPAVHALQLPPACLLRHSASQPAGVCALETELHTVSDLRLAHAVSPWFLSVSSLPLCPMSPFSCSNSHLEVPSQGWLSLASLPCLGASG